MKEDYFPHWLRLDGLGPRTAEAVKTAWRLGWIGLKEEKLTINKRTQGQAFKSIGMGNIRGINLSRGAR